MVQRWGFQKYFVKVNPKKMHEFNKIYQLRGFLPETMWIRTMSMYFARVWLLHVHIDHVRMSWFVSKIVTFNIKKNVDYMYLLRKFFIHQTMIKFLITLIQNYKSSSITSIIVLPSGDSNNGTEVVYYNGVNHNWILADAEE